MRQWDAKTSHLQVREVYKVSCLAKMEKLGHKHFKPLHWKYEQLQSQCNPKKNNKRRSERHENKNRSEAT